MVIKHFIAQIEQKVRNMYMQPQERFTAILLYIGSTMISSVGVYFWSSTSESIVT